MIFKIHSNSNHLLFDKVPLEVHGVKDRKRREKKKEIKKRMESGKKKNSRPTSRAEDKKGLSRNINVNRGGVCLWLYESCLMLKDH